jgi:hypothetical protein
MAFLSPNGITIPVFDASPSRSLERKGSRRRSLRGEVHDLSRGSRRAWKMTACFIGVGHGYEDGDAFEHLVQGEGHYLGFANGLQASTGLQPMPGHAGITWNPANGFGGVPGYLDTTGTVRLQYDAQLGDDWTVVCRDSSAAWAISGLAFTDAGGWDDTTERTSLADINSFSSMNFEVVDGVLTISSGMGSGLDDLVILPWRATGSMLQTWAALGTAEWGPLPVLRVTGDVIAEDHAFMVGEVNGVRYVGKGSVSGSVSTAWVNNAKIVDFTLHEVPPSFVRSDVL